MNARSRALLEELRSLPLEERDEVVAELCEGVAVDTAETPDPIWIAELERRVHAAKTGLSTSISLEQMRAEVEATLRAMR